MDLLRRFGWLVSTSLVTGLGRMKAIYASVLSCACSVDSIVALARLSKCYAIVFLKSDFISHWFTLRRILFCLAHVSQTRQHDDQFLLYGKLSSQASSDGFHPNARLRSSVLSKLLLVGIWTTGLLASSVLIAIRYRLRSMFQEGGKRTYFFLKTVDRLIVCAQYL
jgi:hypothetical protein